MPIVYQTQNKLNGKIYVGVHKTEKGNYLGSGKALLNAIKKYGKENFERKTLFKCKTYGDAYFIEKIIVNEWFIKQRWNYNINGGGYGASVIHPETKEKLSKARKKLNKDPEFLKRSVKATTEGIHKSIKNGTFGHPKGPNNPMYGVVRSKEFCEKVSKGKMKPVLWIIDGEVKKRFNSVGEAATYFEVTRDIIYKFSIGEIISPKMKNVKGILEYEKRE